MILLLLLLLAVGYALDQAERPTLSVLPPAYFAGVARQDAQGPVA